IEVAIISNWDPASFALLKAHLPEFFNLFNEKHMVIPQMIGKTKPSAEIYEYTVKILGVDPLDCFFVDDSAINVAGAQQCGIKAVHHKNWQDTERELLQIGLMLTK
ncbi:MAG: HAD-IA family hydrolase, partial [Candidatus Babeliales bacterium]